MVSAHCREVTMMHVWPLTGELSTDYHLLSSIRSCRSLTPVAQHPYFRGESLVLKGLSSEIWMRWSGRRPTSSNLRPSWGGVRSYFLQETVVENFSKTSFGDRARKSTRPNYSHSSISY